jgi:hypothetical protein
MFLQPSVFVRRDRVRPVPHEVDPEAGQEPVAKEGVQGMYQLQGHQDEKPETTILHIGLENTLDTKEIVVTPYLYMYICMYISM